MIKGPSYDVHDNIDVTVERMLHISVDTQLVYVQTYTILHTYTNFSIVHFQMNSDRSLSVLQNQGVKAESSRIIGRHIQTTEPQSSFLSFCDNIAARCREAARWLT